MLHTLQAGEMPRSSAVDGSQQLAAYVSWVNAQLKKKPGVNLVSDLRQDLRDGVVLTHLIEIVAGELLEGIHYSPRDNQEKKENVEKVLQFVSSKRIRMPQTSARDIVEGNLKSAMRLILALAAHFKPSASANNRAGLGLGRSSAGSLANHRPHSTMAMAQNAAAALAAARHDASRSGRSVLHLRQDWHSRSSSGDEEIENPCWSVRALVQQYEGQKGTSEEDPELEPPSLSSSSPIHNPKDCVGLSDEKAQFLDIQSGELKGSASEHDVMYVRSFAWEEQLWEQQEQLEREMVEARRMVSSLQALLLHGSLPEDEQEVSLSLGEGVENAEQQLVVIRSRLDQSMEESQELKRELLKYKQEARNLQGVKDALQQRMAVQEASVLQLKQELLRTSMNRDELAGQNAELQRKLEERSRLLSEYKKELGQKDRLIQQQQLKLDEALRKLTDSNNQQADLQRELEHKQMVLQELMNHEQNEVRPKQLKYFLPVIICHKELLISFFVLASWCSKQWLLSPSSLSAQYNTITQRGRGAAVGARCSTQPEEQLCRSRPSTSHPGHAGTGRGQPYGPPLHTGHASQAGAEGEGEISSTQGHSHRQGLLATQHQNVPLSQQPCAQLFSLHQGPLLHRPFSNPLHDQHPEEDLIGCLRKGRHTGIWWRCEQMLELCQTAKMNVLVSDVQMLSSILAFTVCQGRAELGKGTRGVITWQEVLRLRFVSLYQQKDFAACWWLSRGASPKQVAIVLTSIFPADTFRTACQTSVSL
uniref:DIX domain containing 1 n=1 Tax=Pygocentrus nattereri TaxID=42514 RepID=A0AAR2KC12_PYGNA